MTETLEVTVLRPAPGLSGADFVAANADIDAYLKRQPGFLWRRITETDDGTLIDIVAYDSHEHALTGAAGISGEMADSPVHESIDHSTVEWSGQGDPPRRVERSLISLSSAVAVGAGRSTRRATAA